MSEKEKNIIKDAHLPHSEELQFLLGRSPSWILRWGMVLIGLVMLTFFLLAGFIKYSDNVVIETQLSTENPPARILSDQSARLENMLVKNGDAIQEGDLIAKFETKAKFSDIETLEEWLRKEKINFRSIVSIKEIRKSNFGELQTSFSSFENKLDKYAREAATDITQQKISSINEQRTQLEKLNNSLKSQQKTLQEEITLFESNLNRKVELRDQNLVSQEEVEAASSALLKKKREKENVNTLIINNDIEKNRLQSSILDLQKNQNDGLNNLLNDIQEDQKNLLSEIEVWKSKFLVLAPKSGKIVIANKNLKNQFIQTGESIAAIIPIDKNEQVIGKGKLPFRNAGKVSKGSIVSLRLDAYPYQEYGSLRALVEEVALLPEGKNYEIIFSLPDGMKSNTGKTLEFRQEMRGLSFVKTEEQSILNRIFNKVIGGIKNK